MSGPVCNHGAKVRSPGPDLSRRLSDRVHPDWVRFTFVEDCGSALVGMLSEAFGQQVVLVERGRGLLGWSRAYDVCLGDAVSVARVVTGGEVMRGRSLLEVSGLACERVKDWACVIAFMEGR